MNVPKKNLEHTKMYVQKVVVFSLLFFIFFLLNFDEKRKMTLYSLVHHTLLFDLFMCTLCCCLSSFLASSEGS